MNFVFRVHAVQRMFERKITEDEVKKVITTGKIIAKYPDDQPFPSKLILGWIEDRPFMLLLRKTFP